MNSPNYGEAYTETEMLQPEDFAAFGHVTSNGKTGATLRRAIPL
jgi:hypothetical protein